MAKGKRNRAIRRTATKILSHYELTELTTHEQHRGTVKNSDTKSLSRLIRREGG